MHTVRKLLDIQLNHSGYDTLTLINTDLEQNFTTVGVLCLSIVITLLEN